MKVDKNKLDLAMATARMNPYDLCKKVGIEYQTYQRIRAGKNGKPKTIGNIAYGLNVDVSDILADEK